MTLPLVLMPRRGIHLTPAKAKAYLISSGLTEMQAEDVLFTSTLRHISGAVITLHAYPLHILNIHALRHTSSDKLAPIEKFLTPSQKSRRQL